RITSYDPQRSRKIFSSHHLVPHLLAGNRSEKIPLMPLLWPTISCRRCGNSNSRNAVQVWKYFSSLMKALELVSMLKIAATMSPMKSMNTHGCMAKLRLQEQDGHRHRCLLVRQWSL
ncbi:hypothetical protein H0H93_015385, partial [Arthromyces matolae]